jgi:hypothetical protein
VEPALEAGREVDAVWGEGCIVGLPFYAFRQGYGIGFETVPCAFESLDADHPPGMPMECGDAKNIVTLLAISAHGEEACLL